MTASLWVQLTPLLHGSAPILSLWEVRHWFILLWVDQVSSSPQTEIWILQTDHNPAWVLFFVLLSCRNRNETITKLYGTKMEEYFCLNHCLQKNLSFFPSDQKYTRRQRCRHTCWLFFFCLFLNKVGRILRQREEWQFCCVSTIKDKMFVCTTESPRRLRRIYKVCLQASPQSSCLFFFCFSSSSSIKTFKFTTWRHGAHVAPLVRVMKLNPCTALQRTVLQ